MFRKRSQSAPKRPSEKVIFKKFLEFLQTSMWQFPTSMFIEQNSIVFDRDQLEPNLFKTIHSKFAKVVDSLIAAHCEDAKITPKELVEALKQVDKSKKLTYKERVLLEPVVAAQDFNVFVPMMMRKNVELQLQALKLVQHVTGMIPTAMTLPEEDAPLWDILRDEDECERYILISVIRKSREDFSNEKSPDEYWGNMADQVKERSAEEEEMLKSIQEHSQQGIDDAIMKNLETGLQSLLLHETHQGSSAPDKPTSPPKTADSDGKALPIKPPRSASSNRPGTSKKQHTIVATPEKSAPKKSEERRKSVSGTTVTVGAAPAKTPKKPNIAPLSPDSETNSPKAYSPANPISPTTKFDYRSLLKDREQIPEEKIAERTAYLKQQRDKLLEMKRAEREKQLQEQSEKASVERPRTAMAARKALSDADSKLESRRAIASKLKAQIVDANDDEKQPLI
uniref:Cilia- and flagella-associated protein 36 n=1 Tax=Panagrolaimus davidi TaxID=227884 RepID=A0A914QQF2_9BILA